MNPDPDSDPDADPDPATFASELQDVNNKKFVSFFAYYFLKIHLHQLIKRHKEVTKQQESMFFLQFLFDD
jgi:hypothetical protein